MVLKKNLKKALHSHQTVYFLKYILRVKVWIFFEWNFNISFCRITNLLGKSLGKWYGACYILFGICPRTSRMTKVWHTYVIMYGNFRVTVEPWQCQAEIGRKLSKSEAAPWGRTFTFWKFFTLLYNRRYPKKCTKNKYVCLNEVIW